MSFRCFSCCTFTATGQQFGLSAEPIPGGNRLFQHSPTDSGWITSGCQKKHSCTSATRCVQRCRGRTQTFTCASHWLPVGQRIDFKIMLLTYKSLHGLGPKYLTDMLPLHKPSRTLRSSETNLLIIPRVNTKHGKAGFSYYATNSWNKLPEDLRLAPTLSTFKTRLKTFMFALAFC